MGAAIGYAAQDSTTPLAPYRFERRALRPDEVQVAIDYCGGCHSDLHQARNDWKNSVFPVVPGHEIVGRVTAIGSEVTKFALGDAVAVGCMVDSCLACDQCTEGCEQYCVQGCTQTYNGRDRYTRENTLGGYSDHVVVRQEFVLRMPGGLDPKQAAPLLCAGITTWSPPRHWKAGSGTRVGLGGLGHMGVKLAAGLGADVTVITTSPSKADDALALGAHRVMLSGSAIGGIAETQELLDFCAERNILPNCETIAIQDINHACERMERSDVKYRFVIDMVSLKSLERQAA